MQDHDYASVTIDGKEYVLVPSNDSRDNLHKTSVLPDKYDHDANVDQFVMIWLVEKPTTPETPQPNPNPDQPDNPNPDLPQTGSSYLALAMGALLSLLGLAGLRKKKN